MKKLACILALCAMALPAVAQLNTYNNFVELAAPIDDADWIPVWDTSVSRNKKISPANLAAGMFPMTAGTILGRDSGSGAPIALTLDVDHFVAAAGTVSLTPLLATFAELDDPGADRLVWFNNTTNAYEYLTIGTGLSVTTGVLNASGGVAPTVPSTRVPYGDGANALTTEAAFTYEAVNDTLVSTSARHAGQIVIGASQMVLSAPVSDNIGFTSDATGDEFMFDMDTDNVLRLWSGTGIATLQLDAIDLTVPTEVYGAGWNGSTEVPTKDALYDKIETIAAGSTTLTSTYVGYGSGANAVTGEAAYTYNATTNTLTVDNITMSGTLTVGTLNATTLNATGLSITGSAQGAILYRNATSWVYLPAGTAGQVLTTGGTGANPSWSSPASGSVATDAIFDVQGDLAVGTGSNTAARLAPGSNGQVLTRDSAEATGVKWATPSSGSSPSIATYRQNVFLWDEFIGISGSNTFGPLGLLREVTGGTVGSGLPTSSAPVAGIMNLFTGTGTTNKVGVMSNASGFSILFGGGVVSYVWETRFQLETLPAVSTPAANEYIGRLGFLDAVSVQPTDGCYFRFDASNPNFIAVCRTSGATETATSTGVAVAVNTWYKLRIEVNAAATEARFYIDGALVRTETANIPSGANARSTSIGAGFIKTTGAIDNDFFFDYMGLELAYGSSR
jgi:hypothetical protein